MGDLKRFFVLGLPDKENRCPNALYFVKTGAETTALFVTDKLKNAYQPIPEDFKYEVSPFLKLLQPADSVSSQITDIREVVRITVNTLIPSLTIDKGKFVIIKIVYKGGTYRLTLNVPSGDYGIGGDKIEKENIDKVIVLSSTALNLGSVQESIRETIDLGEMEGLSIEDKVSQGSYNIRDLSQGYTAFTGNRDENGQPVQKIWLYIGSSGLIGVGGQPVYEEDFTVLDPSTTPEEKYINQGILPTTVGGFKQGDPATSDSGLSLQEFGDKLLFPAVAPELVLSASPQPEFNQPSPYNVDVSWSVDIKSTGAGISSLSLDWRRIGGSYSNITTNNNITSIPHQINSIDNRDIQYKLNVVDTQGAEQSITIIRGVQNYAAPTTTINRSPSGINYERGQPITFSSIINRQRQYSPISNYKFERELNGSWDQANPLLNVTNSFGASIEVPATISNNTNSTSSTRFRIKITDTENNDMIIDTSPLIYLRERYYYGPTASIPTSVTGLDSQLDNNNTINLNTGTTLQNFSVIVPQGKFIIQANDENNLNNDITSEFINQGTLTLQDAGGNSYTATRFVYSIDNPYSPASNLKIIIG